MLVNYSDPARGAPLTRLTLHHNVWNRIFGRLPEVSRENVPDATTMDLEVSANLYWDVRRPAYIAASNPQDGAKLRYRLNWISNYSGQDPAQSLREAPRGRGLYERRGVPRGAGARGDAGDVRAGVGATEGRSVRDLRGRMRAVQMSNRNCQT